MRTIIASDMHLGTASGRDVLRRRHALEALLAAIDGADRLVLLGDLLELRDSPLASVKARAEPVLRAIGEAAAGSEVVVSPGNHDHRIFAEWREHQRLGPGAPAVALEHEVAPDEPGCDLLGWIAAAMPGGRVRLSYPGVRLREDVWATHGHYLDAHNAVPAFEAVAAQAAARATGRLRGSRAAPEDYEAVLAPLYATLYARAQRARGGDIDARGAAAPEGQTEPTPARDGASLSMRVLRRIQEPRGRLDPVNLLLARVLLPGAVRTANLAGLGRFSADLSGPQLRRAGLRALGESVERLGVEARHVIFGHTHRRGPLERDDRAEWRAPGGALLHNCGSWVDEPWLIGDGGRASPYWPGTVVVLDGDEPPRLQDLVEQPAGGRTR